MKLGEPTEIIQFTPPPFDQRILLQSGVLTYMPNPGDALRPQPVPSSLATVVPEHGQTLARLVVPEGVKRQLKQELCQIGICRKSLFPDIEGLSNFVNWETEKNVAQFRRNRKDKA